MSVPGQAGSGLQLKHADASIYVPDGLPPGAALERTTHLAVGAHPDDLEFMAYHGILACHDSADDWFCGVTCTQGGGSVRAGPYAALTDAQLVAVRRREQNAAALIGRYGAMLQLGYSSSEVRDPTDQRLRHDLRQIFEASRPTHVYTHNLVDKHNTHVAVAVSTVQVIRSLPPAERPRTVWGCEVWRSLDWLPERDKVRMDVSGRDNLAAALAGVFDSQIVGKRYDLAIMGRRAANSTLEQAMEHDKASQVILGMDLTALVHDERIDIETHVLGLIDKFRADARALLQPLLDNNRN